MEVNLIKEHDDGGATFRFDMTPEETAMMVLFGIRRALEEAVQHGKEWYDDISEADSSNTEL